MYYVGEAIFRVNYKHPAQLLVIHTSHGPFTFSAKLSSNFLIQDEDVFTHNDRWNLNQESYFYNHDIHDTML